MLKISFFTMLSRSLSSRLQRKYNEIPPLFAICKLNKTRKRREIKAERGEILEILSTN
jgi:hypothetical protein